MRVKDEDEDEEEEGKNQNSIISYFFGRTTGAAEYKLYWNLE